MTSIERQATFVTNDSPIRIQSGQSLGFAGSTGAAIIVIDGSQFQTTPPEPSQNKTGEITMGRTEFYISIGGVALTAVIAACSSVWLISNHVSNSVGDARKELQSAINSSRQEVVSVITTIDNRNNDRFNRIENQFDKIDSKVDGNFRDTSKSLAEIKELISNKK
ncbi:hypothetical protein ACVGA5_001389 [Morganella morganii]|nr:hypothetical protein [Morganella morganii]